MAELDRENDSYSPGTHPRLPVESYAPDGGCPPSGTLVLVGLTLFTAMATGVLASWLRSWCCCLACLVSPIMLTLITATASLVGVAAVWQGRIRHAPFAGGVGVIAMVVTVLAMVFTDYQRLLHDPDLTRHNPALQKRIKAGDYTLDDHFQAIEPGEKLLMAICLIIASTIAFRSMALAASAPFCAACANWKQERRLGVVHDRTLAELTGCLAEGDVLALATAEVSHDLAELELTCYLCPFCGESEPIVVQLGRLHRNYRNHVVRTPIIRWVYPGSSRRVFQHLFRRPKPPAHLAADRDA